jgi:hypothetical protein
VLKTCVFPESGSLRRAPIANLSAPARRASRRAHQAARSEPLARSVRTAR